MARKPLRDLSTDDLAQLDRPNAPSQPAPSAETRVPHGRIRPSPLNPRQSFDPAALAELAGSIVAQGVIQPILLRPDPERAGDWLIVAGERRWRAVGLAIGEGRLPADFAMPATIREMPEDEHLTLAVVENLQRQDLDPLDEAQAYRALLARPGWSAARLAAAIGKTDRHVQIRLTLLDRLIEPVQEALRRERISMAMARAGTGAPAETQSAMLQDILAGAAWCRTAEDVATRIRDGHLSAERAEAQREMLETTRRAVAERRARAVARRQEAGTGGTNGTAGAPDPVAEISAARRIHGYQARTRAMQHTMLYHGEAAIRLLILALLGESAACAIRPESRGPANRVLAPGLADALERLHEALGGAEALAPMDARDPYPRIAASAGRAKAVEALMTRLDELDMDALVDLLCPLVAARCGSFAGFEPELGDHPVALHAARSMHLTMAARWIPNESYLAHLSRDQVDELAHRIGMLRADGREGTMPPAELGALSLPERRAAVLSYAAANEIRHIPPELEFGSRAEVEAAIRAAAATHPSATRKARP